MSTGWKGDALTFSFFIQRNRNFLLLTLFLLPDGGSLQHVIHGLADTFCWAHTHKFFTVFAKCFSCHHHLSMTNFTSKSGFLLNESLAILGSLLEHQGAVRTGLGSAVHYSPLPAHPLPSISVFPESISVCIMPESRKEHSNPTRLEITMLQETELTHLMCISENV